MKGHESFQRSSVSIKNRENIHVVLSQPMSDDFGDISSSTLQKIYGDSFFSFTNIYFHGLHPDLTYYGSFRRRIQSPLGDYHSKLTVMSFVKQKTVEQCLAMFRSNIYEKMGYLDLFKSSSDELIKRDESNGIKFANSFLSMTKHNLTLLSVNHPTSSVIAALATLISSRMSGTDEILLPEFFSNGLCGSTIWPIYPEVAEYLRLSYSTPFLFYPNVDTKQRPYQLREFVEESYRLYSEVGLDGMLEIPLGGVLQQLSID
jgi:hypothetical protein